MTNLQSLNAAFMRRCTVFCVLTFLLVLMGTVAKAQPSSCFEIESILVDACGLGNSEGLNEILVFQVGPAALNTANLTVTWPNLTNTWTGICQNATTTAKVAAINATITGCGRLIEPTGGILPAGKRVVLFASISVDETLHSFAALNDTLIAIFHCGNNPGGNFANSGAGLRTLTMTFSAPVGCTDAVTYDRALLANTNGATVNFCWNGSATYLTPGCVAPFVQIGANAGTTQNLCNGTPAILNGTVSSCTHRVRWFGGTGTFSNPNIPTPTYTPGPGETGAVVLTLQQFTSCDTVTSTVTLNYSPPPTLSLGPDTTFCGTFNYQLGPGFTAQSYLWSTGATTQNLTATTPGTYWLQVTTAAGCVVRDSVVIGTTTLNTAGLPADDTICPGVPYLLFSSLVGSAYQWSTGATTASISITNPGTYSLTLTQPNGCVRTESFELFHYPATTVNLGNDINLCPGNTTVLDADPLGNYPGATYQWSTSATSQTITVGSTGTYSVTITTPNFCTDSDTILVTVSNSIPVNLGADTTLCAGQSLTLTAPNGQSYSWSSGATTPSINVNTTGTYAVTVTFGIGCQSSDTIDVTLAANPTVSLGNDTIYCANLGLTLDAGAGLSYNWNSGATTQTLPITQGGTYSVTVTNASGCTDVDSILVSTGLVPQVNLGPNTQLCPGQTLTLDAGTQATTYLWNTGATTQTITVGTPGTYWAVVTTACGTDSSATTLSYYPVASVNAGPDDTLCAGDTLSLLGASASQGTLAWSYAGGGTLSSNASLHPLFTADSSASGPVDFVLTLTDSCGSHTDTLTLTILPRTTLTFLHPDSVCYNTPIQISYSGNPDSVLWMGAGTFSDSTGNPVIYTPAPGEIGLTSIGLTAYGQCGAEVFMTDYFIQDSLIANFAWSPGEVFPGTHVQFTNGSFPADLPLHWHFGDSFYSVENDPMHRYYTSGTYPVELIVYGVDGCNDTLVIPLNVLPTDTIFPNVFSPNSDGINDFFNYQVPPTESFSLGIWDRWGAQYFYTTNPEEKWDGRTAGGADCPEGVYFYVIRMKLLAGTVLNHNGWVTLLR